MNITFRPATHTDINIIKQLADKIWKAHYPSVITTEQIEYMLDTLYSSDAISEGMNSREKFYLAFIDNKPVAYASTEERNDDIYLHKFYIDINLHKAGIGTKFFHYLLSNSNKAFRLQVNRANYKAINFYFKMGFVIESVEDFPIGSGFYMNDFIMYRPASS